MYRHLLQKLITWKDKKQRLPLIVKGARQVGKTWLLNEFGKTCFREVHYFNFENSPHLFDLFEGRIEPRRIVDSPYLHYNWTSTKLKITRGFFR